MNSWSSMSHSRAASSQRSNYTLHELRHRRITIWHQAGIPARELAERAGHSKPSMSLDVYSHVMPVAEVSGERLSAVLV